MLLCEVESPVRALSMFSVDRISRQGDKYLGRLRMDADTLHSLREDNVGLLFEKFLRLETMLGRIIPLADKNDLGRIAIVYSSKDAGAYIYDMLCDAGKCERSMKPPAEWQVGNLTFTSVEALPKLAQESSSSNESESISMVILLDPTCMVHRARTLRLGNGRTHDRPQIIVNALCDLATDGLQPLFLTMTCKAAISVNSEQLARVYCRETWWFCDGPTIAVPKL
jgi:hypothetical protein